MKTYDSYKGLPGLAGLCTFEEGSRAGLSVEQCVTRLKRYHYAFKRLHQIWIARLTSEPVYELKMAFSLHAHLCAEHVAALRTRVGELQSLEDAEREGLKPARMQAEIQGGLLRFSLQREEARLSDLARLAGERDTEARHRLIEFKDATQKLVVRCSKPATGSARPSTTNLALPSRSSSIG